MTNNPQQGAVSPSGRSRALWSGLEAAATPLGSLLVTVGLVRALGPAEYGLLVVVMAVSTLSMAINPAIAATTTKFVSEAVGAGDQGANATSRLVTASLSAVAVMSAVYLLVTLTFITPLSHLLFGSEIVQARANIGTVLLLAVLTVCIQQVDAVMAAALKGLERFRRQALFELASRLIVACGAIFVGWRTGNVLDVLITQCSLLAISGLLRAVALSRLTPNRRVFARPHPEEIKRILAFGGWMWLNVTATAAYLTFDRIVVGRALGPAAAAEFHVYVQLTQLIHFIPSSLSAFAFPVFSRLGAQMSIHRHTITRLYRRLTAVIIGGAVAIALVLIIFHHQVIGLFSGQAFVGSNDSTFLLLAAGFALLSVNVAPYYLLLGLGRSKMVSLVNTVSVFVTVVLTLLLVPALGLSGAAIARFGYVCGTLVLVERAHKVLKSL